MNRTFVVMLLWAAWAAVVIGCKEETAGTGAGAGTTAGAAPTTGTGAGPRGPATSSSPTQASASLVLQEVAEALDAKDYDRAATYFHAGRAAEQFKAKAPEIVSMQHLSKEGADILGSDGKWGKLAEVFPESRAKELADRAGVPVDQCYGLSHGEAEAGFHWDGREFKLIHCINVGKLKK